MARHIFMVFVNPTEGRDAELNEFYDTIHAPRLAALPGFVSAERFRLAKHQRSEGPHDYEYLAIYEIETDDLKATIDNLTQEVAAGSLGKSDAMGQKRYTVFYSGLSSKIVAKG